MGEPRKTEPPRRPLVYFSIDVEASGPVPALYDLLSIGCTVVREDGDRYALGDEWYVELKPHFKGVDPDAMKVNGMNLEALARAGREPGEAMKAFREWIVARNGGTWPRPVFVGHNAPFDWSYVNYYFWHWKVDNPFGWSCIDTKALAMGLAGIPWWACNKETILPSFHLGMPDETRVHRADYDAHYQAELFARMMERLRERQRELHGPAGFAPPSPA